MSNNQPVWSTAYIIYFVLTILATIVGLFLIHRFVKKEKTLTLILKITAACLLISIIANRICICYYKIYVLHIEGYSWRYLLFNSICSLASFSTALLVLFAKPTNIMFNFFIYIGVGGPLVTAAYPDFLSSQGFAEPASFTGLLHHTILLFLSLALLMTNRFKPSIKKFYVYPLGYALCIILGLFEIQVLNFNESMQINAPLLSSMPILTSWWMIGILTSIVFFVAALVYLHFREHHSFKELLLELKPVK